MADIEFNCPKCGNRLSVDEKGIGLTVGCPDCRTSITIPNPKRQNSIQSRTPSDKPRPGSALFALALSMLALIVAGVGLTVALRVNARAVVLPQQFCYDDPATMIRKVYENVHRYPDFGAEAYFMYRNRSEVLKTLEIVDVPTNGDLAVAFLRFSVGTRVFRDTHWLRKVDGQYWFITYVSKYGAESEDPNYIQKAEWIAAMEKRKEEWEKGSAAKY